MGQTFLHATIIGLSWSFDTHYDGDGIPTMGGGGDDDGTDGIE